MGRLITSGCSFTQYCWNTWADYLGRSNAFNEFIQVGQSGIDNATVARNIVNKAIPGDTVVVLWTGYDRWSNFVNNDWEHIGQISSNKSFFVEQFSQIERFTATIDYINYINHHANSVGYNCYHFSAFPFLYGEMKDSDPELLNIANKYEITNFYCLTHIDLHSFQIGRNEEIITSHKYNSHDTHPTPLTHWHFANEIVAKTLNIQIDSSILKEVEYEQNEVLNGRIPCNNQ